MSNLNDHTRYKIIINGEREVFAHMEGGLLKFDDSEEAKILHTANTQSNQCLCYTCSVASCRFRGMRKKRCGTRSIKGA